MKSAYADLLKIETKNKPSIRLGRSWDVPRYLG